MLLGDDVAHPFGKIADELSDTSFVPPGFNLTCLNVDDAFHVRG